VKLVFLNGLESYETYDFAS